MVRLTAGTLNVVVLGNFSVRGRRRNPGRGRGFPRQCRRDITAGTAAVVVEQAAGGDLGVGLRVSAEGVFRVEQEGISRDVRRHVDELERRLRQVRGSGVVRKGRFEDVELRWQRRRRKRLVRRRRRRRCRRCRRRRSDRGLSTSLDSLRRTSWTSLPVKQRIRKPKNDAKLD